MQDLSNIYIAFLPAPFEIGSGPNFYTQQGLKIFDVNHEN